MSPTTRIETHRCEAISLLDEAANALKFAFARIQAAGVRKNTQTAPVARQAERPDRDGFRAHHTAKEIDTMTSIQNRTCNGCDASLPDTDEHWYTTGSGRSHVHRNCPVRRANASVAMRGQRAPHTLTKLFHRTANIAGVHATQCVLEGLLREHGIDPIIEQRTAALAALLNGLSPEQRAAVLAEVAR